MSKTVYIKKDDQYVEIGQLDSPLRDQIIQHGTHLVISNNSGVGIRYNIDTNYIALLAAMRNIENEVIDILLKHNEIQSDLISEDDIELFKEFKSKLSSGTKHRFYYNSVQEVVNKMSNALFERIQPILENPSVKMAYEHYLNVSRLVYEDQK